MKKHIGKIILIIVLIILIGLGIYGYFFMKDFLKDEEDTKKLMEEIVASYNDFSKTVENISEKRSTFYELKEQMMILESTQKPAQQLDTFIKDYQTLRNDIEEKSTFLKENCKIKYSSKKVNNTCELFRQEYEAAYNYYITDINLYNQIVETYNKYVEENKLKWNKLEIVDLKDKTTYIDYDKDGSFLGGKNEKK